MMRLSNNNTVKRLRDKKNENNRRFGKGWLLTILCVTAIIMAGAMAIIPGGLFALAGETETNSEQEFAETTSLKSITFTVDSFSDFVFINGGTTVSLDNVGDVIRNARLSGDGFISENNELVLGGNCNYEFAPKLGKDSWELVLPDTVSWTPVTKTITTQIEEEDAEGNTQVKEVTVGTITVGQDGKITYTPNPDCPADAYQNSDIQNFQMSASFNVSDTKIGGLEFPGVGTVNFQSRDLAPFLKDAQLTQDGREIGDGEKVVVGEHYNYFVLFEEKGTDLLDRFSNPMHFQLPENVKCSPVDHKAFYDEDYKGGTEAVGWYSVDENGYVTFEFDEDYLKSKTDLKMQLNFDLTVAETDDDKSVTFPWKDGKEQEFETDFMPDANLEKKAGEYNPVDPEGPCIDYTVELDITKGMVNNPTITDTMGEGLSYREGSGRVVIQDKDGNDITDRFNPAPSLEKTKNGWEVKNMPESLSKGEKVTVTYQADVNFDNLGTAANGNLSFTAENKAVFNGEIPKEGEGSITKEADVPKSLTDQRVKKDGSIDKDHATEYPNNLDWEIVVGSGSTDVRGVPVSDQLSGKHWINEERPLELKWKDANDSTIHTFEIWWNDPNLAVTRDEKGKITSFKYVIPGADAENADGTDFWQLEENGTVRKWQNGDHVKLEYYTVYEDVAGAEFTNTAKVTVNEKEFKDEKNVGIGAGSISKSGTESPDGQYMEYSVEIGLPSASALGELLGTDVDKDGVQRARFWIEDQLEFADVKVEDEAGNERRVRYFVDNFPEDVTITATLEDGSVITFTKDGEGENSFKIAKYGKDYHSDWEDGKKGNREFQIWFNTYLGEDTIDKHDSYWLLEQPCTLTITYKVSTDSPVFLEDPQSSGKYYDTELTVRDLLDQGLTLTNEVKAHGKNNSFGTKHKYTPARPEFGVNKNGKVLGQERIPGKPSDYEIEYRVEFNGFTTDIDTGKYGAVKIDPDTFSLEDIFDSRLEYVEGSLRIEVYAPDTNRHRYTFSYTAEPEIVENEDGTTTLKAFAAHFNEKNYSGSSDDTRESLQDYMGKERDALYVFVYKLRAKDKYLNGEEMHFDNKAFVHHGGETDGDDAKVDFTPEVLIKNGEHSYEEMPDGTKGADIVKYTVEVNPGATDMVTTEREEYNPGRYTLIDQMDEALILKSDSIKVYRIGENGEKTELEKISDQTLVTPESDYFVSQEAEGNTFKLILPDEQHLLIEYEARVNATMGSTVKVMNTIKMEGGISVSDKSEAEFNVDGNNASISGSTSLRLFKQDASTGNYIDGATFELYSIKKKGKIQATIEGTSYFFEKYDTLKPDALRGASIGPEAKNDGKYYLLVETEAPDGYQLNEEPVIIVFGEPETGDLEYVTVTYHDKEYERLKVHYIVTGDNVIVFEDEPGLYQLPETGGYSYAYLYLLGGIFILLSMVLLNKKCIDAKKR